MPIMWSNCRLYCQMNFWKANCMTSLIRCLIHSQAFKLMELYWFVCCYSKSTSLSLSPAASLSLFTSSLFFSVPSPPSDAAHHLLSILPSLLTLFPSPTEAGRAYQHLLYVAPWWRCVGQHQRCHRHADVCPHARRPDSPSSSQKRPDSRWPSLCSLQGWVGGQLQGKWWHHSSHCIFLTVVAKIIIQKKISDVIWN